MLDDPGILYPVNVLVDREEIDMVIVFRETFLMKVGLKEERWGDELLIEKLLDMMQQTGADFTSTFRQLAEVLLLICLYCIITVQW